MKARAWDKLSRQSARVIPSSGLLWDAPGYEAPGRPLAVKSDNPNVT